MFYGFSKYCLSLCSCNNVSIIFSSLLSANNFGSCSSRIQESSWIILTQKEVAEKWGNWIVAYIGKGKYQHFYLFSVQWFSFGIIKADVASDWVSRYLMENKINTCNLNMLNAQVIRSCSIKYSLCWYYNYHSPKGWTAACTCHYDRYYDMQRWRSAMKAQMLETSEPGCCDSRCRIM